MKINKKYYKMMSDEIKTIQTEDIKNLGLKCLGMIPAYFFSIPASSSGKYHPANDLGEGGLVRHSISVKRMLDHILYPEGFYSFTDRQKDLLRLAALLHDSMKSGSAEDYERNPHTKFLHPIYAAHFVKSVSDILDFPEEDAKFLYNTISSHMGQWNTSKQSQDKLPLPMYPEQKVLHLADYLASRKDINMEMEPETKTSMIKKIFTVK